MLGHELRNPLGAIRNAVRRARDAGTAAERPPSVRAIIARQVGTSRRLVDDLLDVAALMPAR